MAYRLGFRDLEASFRQVARAEIEGASGWLERADEDPARAIHEARKHLKKSRALLRLGRDALGKKTFRRENATLRDAAAQLAPQRDADVALATLEKLMPAVIERLGATRAAWLHDEMLRETSAASGVAGHAEVADIAEIAPILDTLAAVAGRVDDWPLRGNLWTALHAGAVRIYEQGRKELRELGDHPPAEALHEWRKRAKGLWYQERLLSDLWPPIMRAHAKEAHQLTEGLGDDHDLAMLSLRIRRSSSPVETRLQPVLGLIEEHRQELQTEAHHLGKRLYAETPKAYGRRLTAYRKAL